jgi:LysR family transcriptional regulator, regulator of abg operon
VKLTHLRDVIAVAERGSLRAAARHLGIAQPVITRSIREIEQDLGVVLFERRARGVILTQMGSIFLRRAIAIQNELRHAREELDQLKGMTNGQVSIALSTVPHLALLPRALEPFRARYPDVFLKVTEGLFPAIEGELKKGNVDFYVGPLGEQPLAAEFVAEKLFDYQRVILGRKGHTLTGATSLKDLVEAKWITTAVTSNRGAELGPLFESHGLPRPKIAMEAPSALTMMVAAANSDLLIMLPEQWLDFPAIGKLLHAFSIKEPLPAPPICVIWHAQLPLTPAAELLCDILRRASEHYAAATA